MKLTVEAKLSLSIWTSANKSVMLSRSKSTRTVSLSWSTLALSFFHTALSARQSSGFLLRPAFRLEWAEESVQISGASAAAWRREILGLREEGKATEEQDILRNSGEESEHTEGEGHEECGNSEYGNAEYGRE